MLQAQEAIYQWPENRHSLVRRYLEHCRKYCRPALYQGTTSVVPSRLQSACIYGPPSCVTIPPNGHPRLSIDRWTNFSFVLSIFHAAVALRSVWASFSSLALYPALL